MAARSEARLNDGTLLSMRPIEPGDKQVIADGFERLSEESRYRRFFAPLDHLTPSDLRYLTEVDHHDHEAIIAFAGREREPVGVARFVRIDDPTVAEVAVTVVDDWQGHGVATALLSELVARAREEGIERFQALVLADNETAIDLFQQLSEDHPEPARVGAGNVELLIDLPEGDELSDTQLGRMLRTAARSELVMTPWRVIKERLHEARESWEEDAD
jgi:RimJ/RimL family protein N-acetyltransferase